MYLLSHCGHRAWNTKIAVGTEVIGCSFPAIVSMLLDNIVPQARFEELKSYQENSIQPVSYSLEVVHLYWLFDSFSSLM